MEKVPNNFFSFFSFLFVFVLFKCPDLIYFLEVTLEAVVYLDQLFGATHTPNIFLVSFSCYFLFSQLLSSFQTKKEEKMQKSFFCNTLKLVNTQMLVDFQVVPIFVFWSLFDLIYWGSG